MRRRIHFCCSNQRCALIIEKRRFHGVFGFLHVGTATKSVRQYRPQMARFGRASAAELHRTFQYRALAALLYAYAIHRRDGQSAASSQPMGAACRLAGQRANRSSTKHQTKRSTQARSRRTAGDALVARRGRAATPTRLGDFGGRRGPPVTGWTSRLQALIQMSHPEL
jgi:hypothetical protein